MYICIIYIQIIAKAVFGGAGEGSRVRLGISMAQAEDCLDTKKTVEGPTALQAKSRFWHLALLRVVLMGGGLTFLGEARGSQEGHLLPEVTCFMRPQVAVLSAGDRPAGVDRLSHDLNPIHCLDESPPIRG